MPTPKLPAWCAASAEASVVTDDAAKTVSARMGMLLFNGDLL
jgi:hypothetical protein